MDSAALGTWYETTHQDQFKWEEEGQARVRTREEENRRWEAQKKKENKKYYIKLDDEMKNSAVPQRLGEDERSQAWAERTLKKEASRISRPKEKTGKLIEKLMKRDGARKIEDWVAGFDYVHDPGESAAGKVTSPDKKNKEHKLHVKEGFAMYGGHTRYDVDYVGLNNKGKSRRLHSSGLGLNDTAADFSVAKRRNANNTQHS